MSKIEVTQCNVCGKIKGEANHWLAAMTNDEMPGCIAIGIAESFQNYLGQEDICSQECMFKRIAPYIERKPESNEPQS